MKIIGIGGLGGSGRTTAARAIAAVLVNKGFRPTLINVDTERDPHKRVKWLVETGSDVRDKEFEELDVEGVWSERVIIVDGVSFPEELNLVHQSGGKTIFISANRRLGRTQPESRREDLALMYETKHLDDDTFDFSVSNNESSLERFISIVQQLASDMVVDAREEGR